MYVLLALGSVSIHSDRPDNHIYDIVLRYAYKTASAREPMNKPVDHTSYLSNSSYLSALNSYPKTGLYLLSLQSLNILQTQLKCGGIFIILKPIDPKTEIISSKQSTKSYVPDSGVALADGALVLSPSPSLAWGCASCCARAPIPNQPCRPLRQRPPSLSPSPPSTVATSPPSTTCGRSASAVQT